MDLHELIRIEKAVANATEDDYNAAMQRLISSKEYQQANKAWQHYKSDYPEGTVAGFALLLQKENAGKEDCGLHDK